MYYFDTPALGIRHQLSERVNEHHHIKAFFPFSLKDKAKTWLQNLRPGSICACDEIQQQFLKNFFHLTEQTLSKYKSPHSLKT